MKRKPLQKWVLPAVIDPPGRRCIQVQVPDDPAHIAAFRGAMLTLQSAYNWADDPAHTAKQVALVWRSIIDNMNTWGCEVPTILREEPGGCGIQWSLDNGSTWETIDLSTCITALAENSFNLLFPSSFNTALQQAIADGVVQESGIQPSPAVAPPPGECVSFHVVMQARENWICPVSVSPGSTVHVSAAYGGWNDGAAYWYCPSGDSYGIGACSPETAHFEGTDPLPSAFHMTVVGRMLDSGLWFNPYSGIWTVPMGQATQLFVLQANDQSLSDNYGEIQFDVEICTAAQGPSWCFNFDFNTTDGGWVNMASSNWYAGYGWSAAQYFGIRLIVPAGASFQITRLYTTYAIYGPRAIQQRWIYGGATAYLNTFNSGQNYVYNPPLYFDRPITLEMTCNNANGVRINSILFEGTGVCPFGTPNC